MTERGLGHGPKPGQSEKYTFQGLDVDQIGTLVDTAAGKVSGMRDKAQAWRDLASLMDTQKSTLLDNTSTLMDSWWSTASARHRMHANNVAAQMPHLYDIANSTASALDWAADKIETAKDDLDEIRQGRDESRTLYHDKPHAFDGWDPSRNGRPTLTEVDEHHNQLARDAMHALDTHVRDSYLNDLQAPAEYSGRDRKMCRLRTCRSGTTMAAPAPELILAQFSLELPLPLMAAATADRHPRHHITPVPTCKARHPRSPCRRLRHLPPGRCPGPVHPLPRPRRCCRRVADRCDPARRHRHQSRRVR